MSRTEDEATTSADKRPHKPQTSHTIGYDSAQKSGYDTAAESRDAQRTTNEVDAKARETDLNREKNEGEAHRERPQSHSSP